MHYFGFYVLSKKFVHSEQRTVLPFSRVPLIVLIEASRLICVARKHYEILLETARSCTPKGKCIVRSSAYVHSKVPADGVLALADAGFGAAAAAPAVMRTSLAHLTNSKLLHALLLMVSRLSSSWSLRIRLSARGACDRHLRACVPAGATELGVW